VVLNTTRPPAPAAATGIVQRIRRTGMSALAATPRIDTGGPPFYAKLRAEADDGAIDQGKGKLYLGFHLDPFLGAHWNSLNEPLRFELDVSEGVEFSIESGEASPANVESDVDPREFLIDVHAWPDNSTVALTVTYFACKGDACYQVRQVWELRRERDRDGGRAMSGGRARTPEEAYNRMMEGDKDADGKLTREELSLSQQRQFDEFDLNKDSVLDQDEVRKLVQQRLNRQNR
jgi:hypothetical protein